MPPVLLGTGKEFSKSSTSNRKPKQHNTAVLAALGEAQEGKGPPNPSRQTGRHTLRLVLAALGKEMASQSQCLLRRFRFCRGLEHSYNHTGFLFYRYLYLFFHFHRKQVFLQVKSIIKNKKTTEIRARNLGKRVCSDKNVTTWALERLTINSEECALFLPMIRLFSQHPHQRAHSYL